MDLDDNGRIARGKSVGYNTGKEDACSITSLEIEMKYKNLWTILIVSVLVCGIGGYVAYAVTVIRIDEDKLYPVVSVMDGDTFKVQIDRHLVTVRMLGIDTPETVDPRKPEQCFGKESSDQTKLLLAGREVRLKLNPDREEKDRFGRYLAYVYREDELFVNKSLLENGYAKEYTYGTAYDLQKEFRKIERVSKEDKRGMWGVCEK